jgi:CRP-like cAMP-binding protein
VTSIDLFRHLIPLNALSEESLGEVVRRAAIESVRAGQTVFREGDTDHDSIYLLSGGMLLKSRELGSERLVDAGSDAARYALAQLKPRQSSGVVKRDATIARIDSSLLDRLITLEQSAQAGGIEVVEFDQSADSDWMMTLLRQETFQQLPAANISALFARFEPVDVKAGQVIIKQGDRGDHYYVIREGRANVSRKADSGKVAMLGELNAGQGFGEEALLAGAPRNATVMMLTSGVLMRLGADDFNALLKAPLVRTVTLAQARELAKAGAGLLDVRTEDEFRQRSIKGSVNLPLYLLRMKAPQLDASRKFVALCETGSRSTAAAFLLAERGLDVYVVAGGLSTLPRGAVE